MYGCKKCCTLSALVLLVIGIAFLLVDLGVWTFWNLSWWTVVFLFFGLTKLGMGLCKDCQATKKK